MFFLLVSVIEEGVSVCSPLQVRELADLPPKRVRQAQRRISRGKGWMKNEAVSIHLPENVRGLRDEKTLCVSIRSKNGGRVWMDGDTFGGNDGIWGPTHMSHRLMLRRTNRLA